MAATIPAVTVVRAPLSPGMGFAGLSFLVNAVVVLVSAVVTSRLYGVDVIGRYALAMTPWLLLVSLSTLSEQVAMVRELATMRKGSDEATGLFYAVLTLSGGLTAIMSIPVTLVGIAIITGPADQPRAVLPAAAIVAGYVLFENPAWNLDSVLSAYNEGRRLFWCRLVTVVSFLVFAVALFPVTGTLWGLALANVASFATGLVARLVAVRGLVQRRPLRAHYLAGLRRLPSLLRFGVRLLPGQVFIGLTLQAPLWLIAGNATISQVGAYSRASTMAVRLNEASFRVNEMLFPDLVRLHREGDLGAFAATLERSLRLAMGALLLAAALAGGAAEPVMQVFGDGFSDAAGALTFLVLAHVCFVAASIVASAYNALGVPQLNSAFTAIRCAVALGAVALLTGPYGITVAAAGIFAGYALELAVRIAAFRRAAGVAPSKVVHPLTVVRLVTVYGGGFCAARMVSLVVGSTVVALPLAVVAGTATFAVLSLTTGLLDAGERQAILGRLHRLRPAR